MTVNTSNYNEIQILKLI